MRKKVENASKKMTQWIGSPTSIIIHTIFFIGIFSLHFFGTSFSEILLILTTIVSLEAIYLAIFIQMTVNQHSIDLEEVSEDIEEIQEDMEEIEKDIDEIQEDVEEINEEEEEENQEDKFKRIEKTLESLLAEISKLKK